jgi:uncharacterized Fe-S cluster-containing radical SAM superfamily protein
MIEPNPLAGLFPGATVTGVVGGFVDNGDDFTLNWSGGTTIVDPTPLDADQLGLMIGETVNVFVGEFDGLEIDSPSITRPDGSVVLGGNQPVLPPEIPADPLIGNPPAPPVGIPPMVATTVTGTVINLVDNDEFLLDINGSPLLVDADLPDSQFLPLVPGEVVNVSGILDDEDFDTFSVTRVDGSPVIPTGVVPPVVPPIVPGSTVTGTVINLVDNDEFLLDINGSPLLVDADLPDSQFLQLVPGEVVNVSGILDDEDLDAFSITRVDGSPVIPTGVVPPVVPPVVPGSTVTGTVINLVDNDEFLLDINGSPLLVDADLPDSQFLQLVPGEVVNVSGILDHEDFDAFSITRTDGSPVIPTGVARPGVNDDWDDDDRWDDDWDDDDRWDDD